MKAANIKVESYWPALFAKLLEKRSVEDLILSVGSGIHLFCSQDTYADGYRLECVDICMVVIVVDLPYLLKLLVCFDLKLVRFVLLPNPVIWSVLEILLECLKLLC